MERRKNLLGRNFLGCTYWAIESALNSRCILNFFAVLDFGQSYVAQKSIRISFDIRADDFASD